MLGLAAAAVAITIYELAATSTITNDQLNKSKFNSIAIHHLSINQITYNVHTILSYTYMYICWSPYNRLQFSPYLSHMFAYLLASNTHDVLDLGL